MTAIPLTNLLRRCIEIGQHKKTQCCKDIFLIRGMHHIPRDVLWLTRFMIGYGPTDCTVNFLVWVPWANAANPRENYGNSETFPT